MAYVVVVLYVHLMRIK